MNNIRQETYLLLPQEEDSAFDYIIRLIGNVGTLSRKLDRHDVRELLTEKGIDPDWPANRLDRDSIIHLLMQQDSDGESLEGCSKAILLLILNYRQHSSDADSKEKSVQLEDGDKETVNKGTAIECVVEKRSSSVAVSDTDIRMTEANLRLLMQDSYERAMKAAAAWSFGDLCSVFFSIFGTLFIALLTSDFHSTLFLSPEVMKNFAWVICLLSFVLGISALAYRFWHKTTKLACDRDQAIDELIGEVYEKANDDG